MTEQDIIDAGFERIDVSAEESGSNAYHYYTYDFCSGFSLITPASDEIQDGWYVEVFEVPEIRIKGRTELFDFTDTINKYL
jgi:hypothetical protein